MTSPSFMTTPGAGLFGPDTVTWRVNSEAVLLLGGGRALLLQVAHPLVAAGVLEHSDYDTDPWGRLYRTLDLTTRIVFGDEQRSAAASRRLTAIHAKVRGVAASGDRYDARDPDLLVWVWATLVESSLLVYERFFGRLSPADLTRYYAEQTRFALACGVPEGHWPADLAAFTAYFDEMVRGGLDVADDARVIARAVLRPPLPGPLRPAFAGLVNLATAGLLPPSLRDAYELPWSRGRQRTLDGAITALRRVVPILPPAVRLFPEARRARRRLAQA